MTVLDGAEDGFFEPGDSSRHTKVGRLLRATKLDEFPQFLNVLKGEMSVVGPRPEVRQWVAVYPERWRIVLAVKPGITDPASIEFRNEEEILAEAMDPVATYRDIILPRKLDHYEQYAKQNSIRGDIKIILRTFMALFQKGKSDVYMRHRKSRATSND